MSVSSVAQVDLLPEDDQGWSLSLDTSFACVERSLAMTLVIL